MVRVGDGVRLGAMAERERRSRRTGSNTEGGEGGWWVPATYHDGRRLGPLDARPIDRALPLLALRLAGSLYLGVASLVGWWA